jgi:hypothetical protein
MSSSSNSQTNRNSIDQKKLQRFMGRLTYDLGGAYTAVLVYIGEKLGLYKTMSDAGETNYFTRTSSSD